MQELLLVPRHQQLSVFDGDGIVWITCVRSWKPFGTAWLTSWTSWQRRQKGLKAKSDFKHWVQWVQYKGPGLMVLRVMNLASNLCLARLCGTVLQHHFWSVSGFPNHFHNCHHCKTWEMHTLQHLNMIIWIARSAVRPVRSLAELIGSLYHPYSSFLFPSPLPFSPRMTIQNWSCAKKRWLRSLQTRTRSEIPKRFCQRIPNLQTWNNLEQLKES